MKKLSKGKIKRFKSWLIRFFKGMIIALGFILPGVSGGVLAAILGIYERTLEFLANVTKDFKNNFKFFLPIGIGGILGIGLLSTPLEFLLENYQLMVLWCFSGAIVGTIPALYKESTAKKKRDSTDVIWLIATIIIGFIVLYFMNDATRAIPINFFSFILTGAIIALGILIPGPSASSILLILGLYAPMLQGFRGLDITGVYLPILLGGGVTMLCFAKIMNKLIKSFHSRVYHFILGTVMVSVILIVIPPVASYQSVTVLDIIISMMLFAGGFLAGGQISKLERKYK